MKKLLLFALIFLTACTTKLPQLTVTLPPPPTETPIPKPTFDPDFNQKTIFPGVDPQQFLGQTASEGRQITLPQDVFAYLRQHHLAPLQDSQGFVSRVSSDGVCSVMFPDHLVDSGAALKAIDVTGGQAVFAVNGTESAGQFRFQVPDGVSCVASVAQAGSGFAEGTVLVTLFRNDGKAGAEVLNEEPLRVIADEPNKITFVSLENGFKLVTTDADGNEIETQTVEIDIESQAMLDAQADFAQYGYSIDGLEWVEDENGVRAIDPETGEVVYEDGEFSLEFAILNAKDLAPTNVKPTPQNRVGVPNYPTNVAKSLYVFPVLTEIRQGGLLEERFGIEIDWGNGGYLSMMLDPKILAYGGVLDTDRSVRGTEYLFYKNNEGEIITIPVMDGSLTGADTFWVGK